MTERKFHETTITIKVLSEEPLEWDDLADVAYAINQGDCVGSESDSSCRILDGKECADLLSQFGSEPSFFQLDDDGGDSDVKTAWTKDLHNGDEVTWNDPDQGLCTCTFIIGSIEFKGDVLCITKQDGGYLECKASELS